MRFIAPFAALLIVAACNANSSTAPANDDFSISPGNSLSIENTGLRIRFIRVESDSRCPSDVDCIWAGNARIELEVRHGGVADTTVLNTFDGAQETVAGNYRIRLVSLAPTPHSGVPIPQSAYRATLRVIPVGSVCTEEARPALMVSLTDSTRPNHYSFTNVSVIVRDGAYADSAMFAAYPSGVYSGALGFAHERRGTYTITANANGYQQWVRAGVEVEGDACHVVTVPVSVRFAPQP